MTKKIRFRQRLDAFEPEWDGSPLAGWALNFARQNEWRFGPDIGADDLFQEFALKFIACEEKYRGTITEPKHFGSLFRTACRNRVLDLVRSKFALPKLEEDTTGHAYLEADPFDYTEEACFRAALSTAPAVVQNICASALDGKGGYRKVNGNWEVRSQLLRRLAGGTSGDHTDTLNSWLFNQFGISQKSHSRIAAASV